MKITPALVEEGAQLDAQIKELSKRLADIKKALAEAGPGDYEGSHGTVAKVTFPGPSIKLTDDNMDEVEQLVTKPVFSKLFTKVVSWKPVKSCRDVARALLTPKMFARFCDLADEESSARVSFGTSLPAPPS